MQKSVSYRGSFLTVSLLPALFVQPLHRSFIGIAFKTAFLPMTRMTSRRATGPLLRHAGQVPTSTYHSGSLSNVSSAAAA